MQFEATEDQLMVQQMVRRFVAEQIAPHAAHLAHQHEPITKTLEDIASLGLRGARTSFAHEGSEMDAISEELIIEELSRGDLGLGLMLASHNLGAMLLSLAQHERTARFTTGTDWLGLALVSDELLGDEVTTTLDFVPAGTHLTHYVLASHARAVLIDLSAEQVRITARPEALALRATTPAQVVFESAPATQLSADAAHLDLVHTLYHAHHAAAAVGLAQAAYDVAAAYAHERKQFRRRLTEFQVTQFKLANMATRLQCARHMSRFAATRAHQSEGLRDALEAHAFAAKAASYIADEGVQLHGGYGYTSEYPIERYYRDAVAMQALGGGVHHAQRRAGALFLEQGS